MLPRKTLLFAIAAWLPATFALADSRQTRVLPEPLDVTPVVLLKKDILEGCGLQANYQTGSHKISIRVVGMRAETKTRFVLKATWTDLAANTTPLADMRLKTANLDSAKSFPKPVVNDSGGLQTSADLAGIQGARFIQSVMVGGAEIRVVPSDGEALDLALPGPVPHTVRASYLNCSGDLFRPEGESRRAWSGLRQ